MKLSSTYLTAVAVASALGVQVDDVPAGVVKLDVTKVPKPIVNARREVPDMGNEVLRRAGQEVTDQLNNQQFYYSTNVEIGTPPQKLTMLLDTGSSDTWVFAPNTQYSGQGAAPNQVFNPSSSSTYKSNHTQFTIQYGIGTTQGDWGTDVFRIGGATVNGLSIGTATQADTGNGIIGIGRPQAEVQYASGKAYENLPLKMASEGIINSAAYSLYLNDINAQTGTVLFGGVDLDRFSGSLTALPISHPKHLAITLSGMQSDGRDSNNLITNAMPAVLDSGTSLSYFTADVIGNIHQALNANPSFSIGQKYYCDCNITDNLILNFGSTQIAVPNYNFLWPIEELVSPAVAGFAFPQNSCYLGLETVQDGMDFYLIGDNLLRSFYTVYDIQNNRIAIAQAAPGSGSSNIKAITKSSIPGL